MLRVTIFGKGAWQQKSVNSISRFNFEFNLSAKPKFIKKANFDKLQLP